MSILTIEIAQISFPPLSINGCNNILQYYNLLFEFYCFILLFYFMFYLFGMHFYTHRYMYMHFLFSIDISGAGARQIAPILNSDLSVTNRAEDLKHILNEN